MAFLNISSGQAGFTAVSHNFIDNYMPRANPVYALIYIYILRNGPGCADTKDIAAVFNILESDVINAFKYWAGMKLMKFEERDGAFDLTVNGEAYDDLETKEEVKEEIAEEAKDTASSSKLKIVPDISGNPPSYEPEELEMYRESYPEINSMFDKAEKILGRLLSAADLSTIYSFYDWLRLPFDVIEHLLTHCASKGHTYMKYIEKAAIDWASNDIKTVAMAEEHLKLFNYDFRLILRALGAGSRLPAPAEIAFMDKWLNNYNMPLEIILEACDKSIITLGRPSFQYADTIVEKWFTAGVKTIDDVKKIDKEFKESKSEGETENLKASGKKAKKSKFMSHEQDKRSYEDFEKMESEFLLNKLKGDHK